MELLLHQHPRLECVPVEMLKAFHSRIPTARAEGRMSWFSSSFSMGHTNGREDKKVIAGENRNVERHSRKKGEEAN